MRDYKVLVQEVTYEGYKKEVEGVYKRYEK